ncbi:MAG: PAS domain S-box protein, partial [Sulfurimonas sp.]|nr:PAS domain S-box protein [Sulfurimonas sp.]
QVNKAAENFLNLTKDEILHHSNHTLFHDKNIKESECEICEGIRNGGKLSSYEVFKDPQICNFTVSPINLSNKSTGAIQVCIDMSKDRLAQQELKKLQTAIEQTPVSIVITDVEGNLEYVNPQFLKVTGYTEEEVIGKNPSVLATGYTTDDEYVELWNKIKSGETWSGIFKNIKKNGEEYWETAVISPIRDAGGNIVNYIGVKQDISEKIALESLLKDQEELMIVQSRHAAMGEMIGMIAHQWRQPLSTISMGANNLLLDITLNKVETSSFKEISNLIISQVNYLSNTIDDFKDFFRPKKEKESVSIEDIINDTLSIIGKTLEDSGVEINTIFSSKPIIKTYKREFIQVLINILNNSKEAMNENSSGEKKLFINVKEEKESTIIEICDNGGGIDEHIINNIFEPYFSTKSEKTGTGLGLYMSKTIVEKHLNGKLIAKNNKIGGACFIIILF